MTDTGYDLYGQHQDHASLMEEGYDSPEAYADQGDTRVVRDLQFAYLVKTSDAQGNDVLTPIDVPRDTELTIAQMGVLALRKGESNHSFYTTKELEARNAPASAAPVAAELNLSEAGEYELAEWLKTDNPETGRPWTINEVLERVGDDKELAHRMLQAENIRSDGDPRSGLETGLSSIIKES